MESRIWTGGLLALLLVGSVLTGCRSSGGVVVVVPPPPPGNVCFWPDYCTPVPARVMLEDIQHRAEADYVKGSIDPLDLDRVQDAVAAALSPDLENAAGRHVCHLLQPKPCDELKDFHERTSKRPRKPAPCKDFWHTLAQELRISPPAASRGGPGAPPFHEVREQGGRAMRQVVTRGLPLLVALLLLGGCASSAVDPCDPCAPCPPANHCNWPDTCQPTPARALLVQIRSLADAAAVQQAIHPLDLQRIHDRVAECLLDNLTNPLTGRHVCDVTAPTGCEELQTLHAEASGMSGHPPKVQRERWHTLAEELDSFPSGS